MATPTPFPEMTNISSPVDLFRYNNSVTNNLWGVTAIFGFWIILFLGLSNYAKDKAFVVSSAITFIIASLFWALNLVAFEIVGILFIATLGSALLMFKEG